MVMCTVAELPMLKVLLHAAKHPHSPVNGVLLGRAGCDGVAVKDAVPLFHTCTTLAMPTEVALTQVEMYTKQPEAKGLQIVGYYQSDARLQAAELGKIGQRIADRIQERQCDAVALLLDNKALADFVQGEVEAAPFVLLSKDGPRGWKREGALQLTTAAPATWASLCQEFSAMFKAQQHRMLSDFDDHMDDVTKDWLNPQVASRKMQLPGQQQ